MPNTTQGGPLQDLPPELAASVRATLEAWQRDGNVRRLWARDAGLWTGADESKWLGWLDVVEQQLADLEPLKRLADEVKQAGFTHALLLGMGGSSMCPEVLSMTFGRTAGFPEFHVLDSTDPAQVAAVAAKTDPAHTLFIVASKSGSTLEPNVFMQYFLALARERLGEKEASRRFVAITDPGSQLEAFARKAGFRHIFPGRADIGGRYSALSHFGLVPAAVMGLDVGRLLERARDMARACSAEAAAADNPGVQLGAILGAAVNQRRDKLTLVCSPAIDSLGAWIEQLVAESTGKQGKGVIPVDHEPLGAPHVYGNDRLFVYLRLGDRADRAQDEAINKLAQAGHPVVRLTLRDVYDLGAEFFRWEFTTAVAGAVIGIHPFDQPDVEAAKVEARALTAAYEDKGSLPIERPFSDEETLQLYADDGNARALVAKAGKKGMAALLKAHLARLGAGDYFCLLAFIPMNGENAGLLQELRAAVLEAKHVATCVGFGPRFLHSTGQAHKGGPASGVYLQVTCADAQDLPVPGHIYSFGIIKAAQARGDFAVLAERGRRLLRVHIKGDVRAGLERLRELVRQAVFA